MKFIIAVQPLSEITNRILNIIAQKMPLPILSNFLIEAKDNSIIVTATDLTIAIRVQHPAKVIEEGSTTIPARRFTQLVRELTSSHVEISVDSKEVMHVSAESSQFKLPGLAKGDYPSLPDTAGAIELKMKQGELKDVLSRTAFAAATSDSRLVLTGLSLQVEKGVAYFAGTDGKRLSRAYIPVQVDPSFTTSIIIPRKAVDEIVKGLLMPEEEVLISIMADKIAVESGDMKLITKLIAGDYPNVERVIPKEVPSSVVLHREELISLLRQVSLFVPDEEQSVRFTFTNGELFLSINTTDIGEGKVSMPVNYAGPRFDIAFNPLFFLDALRHSREETVQFGFSDPFNAATISDGEKAAQQVAGPSPLFVLMPMRLSETINQ